VRDLKPPSDPDTDGGFFISCREGQWQRLKYEVAGLRARVPPADCVTQSKLHKLTLIAVVGAWFSVDRFSNVAIGCPLGGMDSAYPGRVAKKVPSGTAGKLNVSRAVLSSMHEFPQQAGGAGA
jgi:hypothetical protein